MSLSFSAISVYYVVSNVLDFMYCGAEVKNSVRKWIFAHVNSLSWTRTGSSKSWITFSEVLLSVRDIFSLTLHPNRKRREEEEILWWRDRCLVNNQSTNMRL